MKRALIFLSFIGLLILGSCSPNTYTPKERGYYRIDFPEKKYTSLALNFPYQFDYPVYAKPEIDSSKGAEPYWMNLQFPGFNGTLHISYKKIESPKMFHQLCEDARDFAYKHTVKATDIEEFPISIPENKVYGMVYQIEGNTASSSQFYVTDSLHHYLRAALYFNEVPREDSIAPVIKFVNADLQRMIKTFHWKN